MDRDRDRNRYRDREPRTATAKNQHRIPDYDLTWLDNHDLNWTELTDQT